MANEITLNVSLAWRKNSQVVSGSCSESYDQTGNAAIGQIQTIGDTTEQVELGEISGSKYLMFKNMAPKPTAAAPQDEIYVDTVTPVVPGAGTAIKLVGGSGCFMVTANDTWYAIATGTGGTGAGSEDLSVVAVEI